LLPTESLGSIEADKSEKFNFEYFELVWFDIPKSKVLVIKGVLRSVRDLPPRL